MTQPLRIALIMQGGRGWIGGMEYIRNIIFALGSLPTEVRETFEIMLLTNTETDKDFVESVRPYLKRVYNMDELIRPGILEAIKWVFIHTILKRPDCQYDTVLSGRNFDFVYPAISTSSGFSADKVAAWIYDFQHKYLPGFFSGDEIKARDKDFARMALESPLIVLSSKTAEADFRKFYPGAAVATKVLPFKVIPHPEWYEVDPVDIQQKYHLPDKFFIISNQFWQHKNHLTVFNALHLLQKRGVHPIVVSTGHSYDYRKPEYWDLILQTIHKLGLAQQVLLLGLLPKNDQIQLLRRSIALIQPSLFEGWSTVVEDARCFGKPLILSDFPVLLEQNPPESRFFERTSPESLASVMEDCWKKLVPGPDLRRESIARETNKKEVVMFAENFLSVARSFGANNHQSNFARLRNRS